MPSSLREAFERAAHTGGALTSQGDASLRTAASPNFRIPNSEFDHPRVSDPQPQPTESGTCEQCGAPFVSTCNAWSLRYTKFPRKRFCSDQCRKRAESARARQRKGNSNAE